MSSPEHLDPPPAAVGQDVAALLNAALDITAASVDDAEIVSTGRHFLVLMDLEGQLTVRVEAGGAGDAGDLVATVLADPSWLRAALCVSDCGTAADPVLHAFGDHREWRSFDVTLAWERRPDGMLTITDRQWSASSWWLFE